MILLKINLMGMTFSKFKRDAPRPIDMDAVTGGTEPPQRMKVVTLNIHIFQVCHTVQNIKPHQNSFVQSGINSGFPGRPKDRHFLTYEGFDHMICVSDKTTYINK
jgi:hypothetical protein